MTNNLNLLYSGGSGGFLLLHLLLLSERYTVYFPNDHDLNEIIEYQWNIDNPNYWKNKELWPDNNRTKLIETTKSKIYFYCNPFESNLALYGDQNLVLYTDFESQVKLSFYKKANWFTGMRSNNLEFCLRRIFLRAWQTHYNNLKDPSWPDCNSVKKIKNLPKNIQKELLENPYTDFYLTQHNSGCYYPDKFEYFSEQKIHKPMVPWIKSTDLAIKLQDLINTDAEILVNLKIIEQVNNQQKNLIKHWRKLHSTSLLNDLGIIAKN